MREKEVVESFLEREYFVQRDAVEYLTSKGVEDLSVVFEGLRRVKVSVVEKGILENLLSGEFYRRNGVKIVNSPQNQRKKLKVRELHTLHLERFNFLSGIISKKLSDMRPLSIGKITRLSDNFILIGMVLEKLEHENSVVLEDLTGSVKVSLDGRGTLDALSEGDVVGIKCKRVGGKIRGERVYFPDVPLRRKVSFSEEEVYCVFASLRGLEGCEEGRRERVISSLLNYDFKNVFHFLYLTEGEAEVLGRFREARVYACLPSTVNTGGYGDADSEGGTRLTLPVQVEVCGVNVLLLDGPSSSGGLQGVLRRRYVPVRKYDFLLLKEVPDIVVCFDGDGAESNYKGTSLFSVGNLLSKPIAFLVNLKERKSIKVELV